MEGMPNRRFKVISNTELLDLGIKPGNVRMVESIDELRETTPNIVVCECLKTVQFKQNNYRLSQQIHKKSKYLMSLGIYNQLYYDVSANQRILKPANIKFEKIYKPYTGQDLNDKTLLVWRQGGLGDLCFIQPNLKYLKEKYPTCKIFFACGSQYHSMVKTWSCIDMVLDLPFSLYYIIHSDYHAVFEGVIERTKQAEKENAYRLFSKWLGLNLPDDLLFPEQTPSDVAVIKCKEVFNEWGINEKEFITIQMRSSSPIRNPNPEMFKKLINELTKKDHTIVLTDVPQMEGTINEFIKKLDNPEKVFNFSKFSREIEDTIALASLSSVCVGTDSSLNHLSISVKTPTMGIFGPFTGEIRLGTYPENMREWIDCQDDCAPCFTHSMVPCRNALSGYSKCYTKLNINLCVEKIEKLLNKKIN
jgi:ADP-heptose:LPS heptosyltransferase